MRITRASNRALFASVFSLITCITAPGQAQSFRLGDVLLNNATAPNVQQYRGGNLIATFAGSNDIWEGAALTPDGRVATTFRGPSTGLSSYRAGGLKFFGPDGAATTVFAPQLDLPGDISVFRDGTLAVSNQFGSSIELFTSSGSHIRSITSSAFLFDNAPFGTTVGPDDTLWVALGRRPTIHRFSKTGTHLGSFNAAFNVADLVVDPFDGSLWLPNQNSNTVHHYSPTGVELSSFVTNVTIRDQGFNGIAMSPQRTLYVVSEASNRIYHYDRSGLLLGSIRIVTPRNPLFLTVVVPEPATNILLVLFFILRCVRSHRTR